MPFLAFGLGPRAKIVGKSQGKCKNKALGKMANFGPFSGPRMAISCQKRRPCFDNFPVISCVFHIFSPHNTTPHTPYHTHFSLFLVVFSVFPHAHSTQHTHSQTHTRTHTFTPATDRDLESGLSKSNTRKNRENAWKRQSQGNPWRRLVSRSTGKSFVCGEVAKDQSNHLVAGSLRNFSNFQEKAND